MNKRLNRKSLSCLLSAGLFLAVAESSPAQCVFNSPDCTAGMSTGTTSNFNALTWTHNSGPLCPTGASTSYTGRLRITMANNTQLTFTSDFTAGGDFKITNSGSNATIIIPASVTLTVHADFGDCTNNTKPIAP